MPHPKRFVNPKIPRFSDIVKSDVPTLQSPHAHENDPLNSSPSLTKSQPFNPRVAAYTFAFVGVIVGGVVLGAKSKEMMQNHKVLVLTFQI